MSGFRSGARVAVCAISSIMLAGCATTGIREIDQIRHGDYVDESDGLGNHKFRLTGCANPAVTLEDARDCVQKVATSLSETQLGFYDEASGWNYAFTTVAGGVIGTAVFGAAPDAVKAVGLGGGSLAALNAVQPPIALAGAYGSGAVALQCVADASRSISAHWQDDAKKLDSYKGAGDGHLDEASAYVASDAAATDPEIATLKAAIDAYKQAQQLYASVNPFLANLPAILVGQIDTVRIRIIQKLAPNSTSIAGQETAINNYITAMQASAAGSAAGSNSSGVVQTANLKVASYKQMQTTYRNLQAMKNAALGTGGASLKDTLAKAFSQPEPPPPPNSLELAKTLGNDAASITTVGQTYSAVQTQITGCIAKMP